MSECILPPVVQRARQSRIEITFWVPSDATLVRFMKDGLEALFDAWDTARGESDE